MFASDIHAEDQTRQRLRAMGDSYIDVVRLAPMQLDARIRAERIDVLLELGGHSAGNRLPGLLGKPAPVIVTAIGYPHTTGVPSVDYRVVDSLTDPPGAEAFATERLLRLDPCFLCYRPPTDAPDVAAPPSSTSSDAPIRFASFNALYKLSNEAIALWSRVLNAVPSSVFVLRGAPLDDPAVMSRIRSRFEACGVSGSRVRGVGSVPTTREHLARYEQIDVALDVIPYHGTTTTCEALWMGVPVVSLVGESHASRVGLSLLTNVGHPEWAVRTPDEFVRVASELASDRTRLATIRSGLREQVRRSPLCDEAAYAGRFYAALRECWRTWCASRS
jgi:predicted O-linked N-acetylglucosamine transferase (SPINDLY family)